MFKFFGDKESETPKVAETVVDTAVDTAAKASPETNKASSTQGVSQAVDSDSVEDIARFEKHFPSFAGCYGALSPDIRARMWADKVEATSTVVDPIEGKDDSAPKIRDVPQLNMEMAIAEHARAIQEGDQEAIVKAQSAIVEYQEQIMGVVHDYGLLNTHNTQKVLGQIELLKRPGELRAAGASVPGFEEQDVASAAKLLDSGQIQDPGVAVKFVIHQRLVASNKVAPPTAAEDAARQVSAATAASAPDGGTQADAEPIVATETFTDPKFRASLRKVYDAAKQKQT